MTNYKNISFFNGLNSLRFFAALLVVLHHSETIRFKNGLPNLNWLGLFKDGSIAVTFFFVLSGFLITYLLLKENGQNGTVSIKRFYLKRVLRIWPLYFLLVIFGTLLLPALINIFGLNYVMPYTFGQTWHYFLFFLPGLVTYFFGHHLLEPLWSIGIEEVFYLIWAPLFKFAKKYLLLILISIIAIKSFLIITSFYIVENNLFSYLVDIFQFEAMAVGGLGAYFIYNRNHSLSGLKIYKIPVQIATYSLLVIFLVFNRNIDNSVWNIFFKTPIFSQLFICFLFLYLIIGVSLIDHSIFKLRKRFFSYLGEISYGIYMYHMPIIFGLMLVLQKQLSKLDLLTGSLLYYPVTLIVVVGVSAISKRYFEDFFLKLKDRIVIRKKVTIQ